MRIRTALISIGVVVVVAVVAFLFGRLSAPAPTFEAGASAELDDDLSAAWGDFIRAQDEALQLMQASEFFGDDQERAEAYRGVLYALVGAIKTGGLMDRDRPRFMRAVDWTSKSGLDNPDNKYYLALIRDDAEYRVTGTRGTTKSLVFQLLVGQPGVRGAGTSTHVSMLDARDMAIDRNGSFEIYIGRNDPGQGRNWLRVGDGAETLIVRFSHGDWDREQAGRLRIERIGSEGEAAPALDSRQMAFRLRDVATTLFDRTATWLDFAGKAWRFMPRNEVSQARETRGGLVGQYSAFGSFELGPDEALIVTTHPSNADYQGIELGNLWFVSFDYETHTSSLTTDQAYLSSDGRYHFVVSARDPGIQNWLDRERHRRGLIMLRWQGLDAALNDTQQPSARVVKLDQLRAELPDDTPDFSVEQRREQIRKRRLHTQQRFDG